MIDPCSWPSRTELPSTGSSELSLYSASDDGSDSDSDESVDLDVDLDAHEELLLADTLTAFADSLPPLHDALCDIEAYHSFRDEYTSLLVLHDKIKVCL